MTVLASSLRHMSSISLSSVPSARSSSISLPARTSFTLEHRLTAGESPAGHPRLVATAEGVQVLYDYAEGRPREIPPDVVARLEAFEGRPLR